jgi:hypothetical protein
MTIQEGGDEGREKLRIHSIHNSTSQPAVTLEHTALWHMRFLDSWDQDDMSAIRDDREVC